MARRPSRTLLSPGPLVLVLILFPMYMPLLFILLLTHKPLFPPLMHKPLCILLALVYAGFGLASLSSCSGTTTA